MFVCIVDCQEKFLKGKVCTCGVKGQSVGPCELCGNVESCVDHTCYKHEPMIDRSTLMEDQKRQQTLDIGRWIEQALLADDKLLKNIPPLLWQFYNIYLADKKK